MAKRIGNPNHPKKGSGIKVNPILCLKDIETIKSNLKPHPRSYCLFVLGINTAFRANELLSLKIKQVENLKVGSRLEIKQSKTNKYRAVTINNNAYNAIRLWLEVHPKRGNEEAWFFMSKNSCSAICVSTLNNLVKSWCSNGGVLENTGSHTLRKTWGYHQRVRANTAIPLLMVAFGHTSQAQTLDYLCIQADELQALYIGLEI